MRSVLVLAGVTAMAVAGVALSACTSSSPPPAPKPSRLSPTIPGDPLDFSASGKAPCDKLLRPDQLAQFHITTPGVPATVSSGPGCRWTPDPAGLPTYLAAIDLTSGGLENLYRHRSGYARFVPARVSEYPAVHLATNAADFTHGRCTVRVGVADDTLVTVDVTERDPTSMNYTDPCPDADAFAAAIIANAEGQAP